MSAKGESLHRFQAIRFIVVFLGLSLALTLLVQTTWIDQTLLAPYTRMLTSIAGGILHVVGREADVTGTIITERRFAVDIRRGCDGVVASILLISACLAYPFGWRQRFAGMLTGFGIIFVLNMVRIVVLFIVGASGSTWAFNLLHTYVSQFAVIALTMVFWIYWISREPRTVSR